MRRRCGCAVGLAGDAQGAGAQGAAPMHVAKTTAKRHGQMAQVTGIRHWSTPNYTRVAIDLGDDVTYEAARVPNPDRIYFDLHGTRLAQELVGKSFAVTDDGFLKKIRAAQFSNDMTRVVLDVNDVTEYSAFLLPNPYRLIIDIHGGSKAEPGAPVVSVPMQRAAAAAPTVPNTTAVKSASSFDVAALSAQPGRVEATTSAYLAADLCGGGGRRLRVRVRSGGRWCVGGGVFDGSCELLVADVAGAGADTKKLKKGKGVKDADAVPARAAVPMADGETSMVRALGLKVGRIVIDAGHGGHDSGTLGVDGIEEKDVVLDVALRLGKLLHDRLGSEIIYTRSDDTFIPLETRTAIANKAQADLFLSIHANSSAGCECAWGGDVLSELHFVAGCAGDGGARECGFGSVDSSVERSGEEDCAEGQDRGVAGVCGGCGAEFVWWVAERQCGVEGSRGEEGSVCGVDWGEYAFDSGGDFVCYECEGCEAVAAAGVSGAGGGESL